eukprot:PhM_4_TR15037/c0_g1_i1/m.61488
MRSSSSLVSHLVCWPLVVAVCFSVVSFILMFALSLNEYPAVAALTFATDVVPTYISICLMFAFPQLFFPPALFETVGHARATLLSLSIVMWVVFTCVMHFLWPAYVWQFLGYVSIIHMATVSLFTVRMTTAMARSSNKSEGIMSGEGRWLYRASMILVIGPLVIWHSDPYRDFDWFDETVPHVVHLSELIEPVAWVLWGTVLMLTGVFVVAQAMNRDADASRRTQMGAVMLVGVSWGVGLLSSSRCVSQVVFNIPHAAMSLGIIGAVCWQHPAFIAKSSARALALLFIAVLLSVFEESIWVYYIPQRRAYNSFVTCGAVSMLLVPHFVHSVVESMWVWCPDNVYVQTLLGISRRELLAATAEGTLLPHSME